MPRLLINIITRACYDKAFKRLAGWRGMGPTPSDSEAWTFKISGHAGIFGVCCAEKSGKTTHQTARFLLHYFPEKTEPEVEVLNLHAAAMTQHPDYLDNVRDFACLPEMRDPFLMGQLTFTIGAGDSHLSLRLEAPSRKQVIASDGIPLPEGAPGAFLVLPGACEEDFPAFDVVSDLFLGICAAVSFTLTSTPQFYCRMEKTGRTLSYNADGEINVQESFTAPLISETFGYGDIQAMEAAAEPDNETTLPGSHTWHTDLPMPPCASTLPWRAAAAMITELDSGVPVVWDKRPQLIVLTGFLGAGKTTFINNFVEYHTGRNSPVAVVQNEIGETGVDGRLLESECSVVEIDEGCVCCTLAGQLSTGISKLLEAFTPNAIVLETTGLANTFNLLDEIHELRGQVRFDSVTTIVDCANAMDSLEAFEVARDQVRAADIILLNKTDLVTPAQCEAVATKVNQLNPDALCLRTHHGSTNPGLLYGDAVDGEETTQHPLSTTPHTSHGEEGIGTVKITFDAPVNREAFMAALNELPTDILRVKGIIRFDDMDDAHVCQYVGGRLDLSRHTTPTQAPGFVIVIGRNIHSQKLPGVLNNGHLSPRRPHDDPHRLIFSGSPCGHH